jgi:hypothetical protein
MDQCQTNVRPPTAAITKIVTSKVHCRVSHTVRIRAQLSSLSTVLLNTASTRVVTTTDLLLAVPLLRIRRFIVK